jgi:hypothetical protein
MRYWTAALHLGRAAPTSVLQLTKSQLGPWLQGWEMQHCRLLVKAGQHGFLVEIMAVNAMVSCWVDCLLTTRIVEAACSMDAWRAVGRKHVKEGILAEYLARICLHYSWCTEQPLQEPRRRPPTCHEPASGSLLRHRGCKCSGLQDYLESALVLGRTDCCPPHL